MWEVEDMCVRRLLQWSLSHCDNRLVVNTAYPRVSHSWNIEQQGKYLLNVMCGVDISVLHVNVTGCNAYIVDGAARVGALIEFYQGITPMVVEFNAMPDQVSFHPHNVPKEVYLKDRFCYEQDTLVAAYFSDFPTRLKQAFLSATIGLSKLHNVSVEREQQVHWQNNNMCPSSPLYTKSYDEVAAFGDVASRMNDMQVQLLVNVFNMIGGTVHERREEVVRAEILRFARSMLQDIENEDNTPSSSSVSSSSCSGSSEHVSSDEDQGPQLV
jgi:hypothetical protein